MFEIPGVWPKKKHSTTQSLAWFALGAAVGAGVSMLRKESKGTHNWVEEGSGPAEANL